jgi:hypothetical protein
MVVEKVGYLVLDQLLNYGMKNILRLEEAAQWALTIFLSLQLPFAWWWYWVLFLTPDVSMIGYLITTKIGAFTYNIVHHKGIAVFVYGAGLFLSNYELQFAGLLLYGHSCMDRIFGYGLKYNDNFKNTHLGWIGKN